MVTAQWLSQSELFAGLSARQLESIAALCREETYPAHATVFQEGEPAKLMYILVQGSVALRVQLKGRPDTTRVTGVTQPGAAFGWSALVEPRQYTASAVTVEETHVVVLDGTSFLATLREHPEVGFVVMHNLAKVVASRLRSAYEQFTSLLQPGLISHG